MQATDEPIMPSQMTILVVEDDESARVLMSRYLEREGYSVHLANDAVEALKLFAQHVFDLVLLDVMMPKMNGLEVLQIIRSSRDKSALPVIMTTALDQSDDIVCALELGANDYITKPIDYAVALARIRSHLMLSTAVTERSINRDPAYRGGRYFLEKLIGRGGFGCAYLARDTHRPGHPRCVVKQLQLTSNEQATEIVDHYQAYEHARRLFVKEAQTLEHLGHHPHIPHLLAYFDEGDHFYLVQEYIEGLSLRQHFYAGNRWTQEDVLEFLNSTLQTLAFVHDNGVIHRDIKPDNIIRTYKEDSTQYTLIDFGSVKELQPQLDGRVITVFVGTPGYAPYEQYIGRPRFSSDIYALGRVAIEGLTGVKPSTEYQDPDSQTDASCLPIDPDLQSILNIMTDPDPEARYQSVQDVLAALNTFYQRSDVMIPYLATA